MTATTPTRLRDACVWLLFAAGVVLATSPVWGRLAFGLSPELDQLLQIVCTRGEAPR